MIFIDKINPDWPKRTEDFRKSLSENNTKEPKPPTAPEQTETKKPDSFHDWANRLADSMVHNLAYNDQHHDEVDMASFQEILECEPLEDPGEPGKEPTNKPKVKPSPFSARRNKSLGTVQHKGFTGKKEDKLGRERCYNDGMLVSCHTRPDAKPPQQSQTTAPKVNPSPVKTTGEDKENAHLPPLEDTKLPEPPKNREDAVKWIQEAMQHPYIQEAEKRLANETEQTIDKFKRKDGSWDPQRVKEVHEPIINGFVNPKAKPPAGKKPRLVMLIGPFGAGKTSVGGQYVKELMSEFTLVNPDEIKGHMPEDKGYNATNTHEESSYLAKQVQGKALEEGHNILYDGSGQNTGKMNRMADEYTQKGYDVHVIHITVPSYVSVYRAAARFLTNPFGMVDKKSPPARYAPLEYVFNDVDSKPDKTYETLKGNQNVKSGRSFNNDKPMGEPAIPLDHFDREEA